MIERLEVELFGQAAGTLEISGPLRSPEDWTFTYHREYIRAGAPALSVTMPLREDPWVGAVARNFDAYSVAFDGQSLAVGQEIQPTAGVTLKRWF